jgi:hypothetical protein
MAFQRFAVFERLEKQTPHYPFIVTTAARGPHEDNVLPPSPMLPSILPTPQKSRGVGSLSYCGPNHKTTS